jgi:hypothetical protein
MRKLAAAIALLVALIPVGVSATPVYPIQQPFNLFYYGWFDANINAKIIDANPQYLIANSPAGVWHGNANIDVFTNAGIKYFEYLDGGYENTVAMAVPNDLETVLSCIDEISQTSAYGIFLDEVSDGIYTEANYSYLQAVYNRAHSYNLAVCFNVGVSNWSPQIMSYCDYISSSEVWQGDTLTASQSNNADRLWLTTQYVSNSISASLLTEIAYGMGVNSHYACYDYNNLPSWLDDYATKVNDYIYKPPEEITPEVPDETPPITEPPSSNPPIEEVNTETTLPKDNLDGGFELNGAMGASQLIMPDELGQSEGLYNLIPLVFLAVIAVVVVTNSSQKDFNTKGLIVLAIAIMVSITILF